MRHPTLQLKQAYLALRRTVEMAVAPLGLTAAQFDVVQQLLHEDGLEHREMQRRLQVASPTLTNVVDGLIARGHVERRSDGADARVRRLWLTPSAHALVRSPAFREAGERVVAAMFAGFSAQERAQLLALLGRLERNLSPD